MGTVQEDFARIKRGTVEIIPEEELLAKLERFNKTGQPLVAKLGCDPSRPDLHLGHSIVLRKLRQLQDLGHQVVLVIGDFTGMIGDPSGRSTTRPQLSLEETRANGQSYFQQATKILDPQKARMVYNSEWLGKMSFSDVVKMAAQYTVARMLERDDFALRYHQGQPISIHEFLYPLAQAMDSVVLKADIELGGTDQTFNLLVGRDLQRAYSQEPQVAVVTPLLEGLDGKEKMSKSLNNYIGLDEPPAVMFEKAMKVPDELVLKYCEFVTELGLNQCRAVFQQSPYEAHLLLARDLVRQYHGETQVAAAEARYRQVARGGIPVDLPVYRLQSSDWRDGKVWICRLLASSGLASSNGDARRLIQNGGVRLDGTLVADPALELHLTAPVVLQVGKDKFRRIEP